MTKQECIKILTAHNKWRRGGKGKMTNPVTLGIAIDAAIKYLQCK